jgi:Protein of unknown function (DUF4246)
MGKGKRGREIRPMRRSPGKKMDGIYDDGFINNNHRLHSFTTSVRTSVINYAIAECRWRAKQWEKKLGYPVAICKAGLVLAKYDFNSELRAWVVQGIRRIHQNEPSTITTHPYYHEILHIVHPSLYCLNMEKTRVIDVGAGNTKINSMD